MALKVLNGPLRTLVKVAVDKKIPDGGPKRSWKISPKGK